MHGKQDFAEFGHHAHQGRDPHPEQGAGAAHGDGQGHAHHVTGTDIGGQSSHEGIPRRNLAVFGLMGPPLPQALVSSYPIAKGEKAQRYVQIDARAYQQHQHDRAPQKAVKGFQKLVQLHFSILPGLAPVLSLISSARTALCILTECPCHSGWHKDTLARFQHRCKGPLSASCRFCRKKRVPCYAMHMLTP